MNNAAGEVNAIARLLQKEINQSVLPEGLSRQQYQVLSYIYSRSCAKRDVYQRDVEARFKMPRSTVSGLMKELEAAGFIRREQVESDIRLKRLVLTERPARTCLKVRQGMEELNEQLSAGVSEEEFTVFRSVAAKMRANLANA